MRSRLLCSLLAACCCCALAFARVRDSHPGELRVSMVELLANPREFHEKKVRVVGCYWVEEGGGDELLFVSKDARRIWDPSNSVTLGTKDIVKPIDPALSGLFIEVVGTFIYDEKLRDRFIVSITNFAPREQPPK